MKTPALKNLYWLVKREFWEHRGGFFWAPVISGGVFLLLNIMGLITGEVLGRRPNTIHFTGLGGLHLDGTLDASALQSVGAALDLTLYAVAGLVVMIMAIIVFFYCIGCLYDDRRDRSVLFWKSLPISDRETVLSKVVSALVVAPTIACLVGVLAGLLLIVVAACVASLHGLNVWQVLMHAHPLQVAASLIALIPMYAIWALPTVGWLMLCSAWARGKPFLWALVVPLASGVIVSWFGLMGLFNLSASWFWSNVVGRLLLSIIPGGWLRNGTPLGHPAVQADVPTVVLDHLGLANNYATLAAPDVWVGALAGIGMIAAAVWFRRWRDEG
jgi:ABC-2 type transport system permease protein